MEITQFERLMQYRNHLEARRRDAEAAVASADRGSQYRTVVAREVGVLEEDLRNLYDLLPETSIEQAAYGAAKEKYEGLSISQLADLRKRLAAHLKKADEDPRRSPTFRVLTDLLELRL